MVLLGAQNYTVVKIPRMQIDIAPGKMPIELLSGVFPPLRNSRNIWMKSLFEADENVTGGDGVCTLPVSVHPVNSDFPHPSGRGMK